MINYITMYKLKNYLLSMQSHWMINQHTYNAVQETLPIIAKFKSSEGMHDMPKTPIHDVVKKYIQRSTGCHYFAGSFANSWLKK